MPSDFEEIHRHEARRLLELPLLEVVAEYLAFAFDLDDAEARTLVEDVASGDAGVDFKAERRALLDGMAAARNRRV